jgi:hypothetical protein
MGQTVKSWYEANPALYEEVRQIILVHFPALIVQIENQVVYIRGTLPVLDLTTGEEIDRYLIEIEFPADYPKAIPIVTEKGGRIPKIIDRHIFPSDGTCCLFVRDEQWRYHPEGTTILEFINGPVYQYFLSQSYFELTGKWLFGERRHGILGILEYYSEELETKDLKFILGFLDYLSKKVVKGHWDCFCGSGKRLRHCHISKLLEMRDRIPRLVARDSLAVVVIELERVRRARVESVQSASQRS